MGNDENRFRQSAKQQARSESRENILRINMRKENTHTEIHQSLEDNEGQKRR